MILPIGQPEKWFYENTNKVAQKTKGLGPNSVVCESTENFKVVFTEGSLCLWFFFYVMCLSWMPSLCIIYVATATNELLYLYLMYFLCTYGCVVRFFGGVK